jgi:Rrf2 family protein
MVLRNQVEWALHCCAVLAGLEPGQYLATKDLAEFHGVPKEYLSKALQALSQAKIVETTLGPAGGYRLKKSPEDISFLEIIEAIEGRTSTFECSEIRKNNPCLGKTKISGVCAVAKVMYRADEAWRKELRAMTLAMLMKQLMQDIPMDVLEKNRDWLLNRR